VRVVTLDPFLEPAPRAPRVIAHVDMDAFYASVEVRDNPVLRGLPVVVGADPQRGRGRGVVTTASYEARKYGVKSAMPISRAYHACPHAVFLRPRFERYREVSARVFAILREHASVVEAASIDEAYLDFTADVTDFEHGVTVARAIRDAVADQEGLTCSVGVAGSRMVAKVASDARKPGGLTAIPPGDEAAFLAAQPVRVIPGVGPRTAEFLEAHGFTTCADLARADAAWLAQELGAWGPRLTGLARGDDPTPVVAEWDRKSVGAESTFPEDEEDVDALTRTLNELAEEAAEVLQDGNLGGRTVTVKLRLTDFTTFTRSRTLPHPVSDAAAIADAAKDLFAAHWPGTPVRLLGVRVTGLTRTPTRQAGLTEWPADILGEDVREWMPSARTRRSWFE
jgi:nucleotidyltransferase/DNA polymerase involved in DNA repair